MSSHPSVPVSPTNPFEAAYQSVRARADALDESALDHFNADVPHASGVVLARLPALLTLRPEFVQLYDFDLAHHDELGTLTMALAYSHGRCVAMQTRPEDFSEAVAESITLRTILRRDAQNQCDRGLLPATALAQLDGSTSYRGTASDLLALYILFQSNAAALRGHTGITPLELERASELAHQLLLATGQSEDPNAPGISELSKDRQRFFTLFNRAYNEVRRAVNYLRWNHDDADQFAPSLFARRASGTAHQPGADKPATAAAPAASPAAQSALAALTGPNPDHSVPQNDPFKR